MKGDERRRFCASCKLHVHDISAMTREQALAFLASVGQGRACVRLFRRSDGTVLTRDCPVGLRQKLRRMWARAAALCVAFATGLAACVRPEGSSPTNGGIGTAQQSPAKPVDPTEPMRTMGEAVMGDYAPPPPAPQPPTTPRPPKPPPR